MAAVTMKNSDISPSSHSLDSLAVRREARRRKILDNAESRLKKLTGVEQKSNVAIDDFRPINNVECDDTNSTQTTYCQNDSLYTGTSMSQLISSNLSSTISPEFVQSNSHQHSISVLEHNGYKFCILLGIGFIANILLMFSNSVSGETEKVIGCGMIFIPFFGYKLVDFVLNKNITENSILQLLLMMNFRNDTLKRILIYIPYLTRFTQDLFVYFFVFIVANQLLRITFWLR